MKSRVVRYAAIAILAVAVGVIIWRAFASTPESSTETYIAILTAVVEVVIITAGIFGLASGLGSLQARRDVEELTRDIAESKELFSQYKTELDSHQKDLRFFLSRIETAYGVFKEGGSRLAGLVEDIPIQAGDPLSNAHLVSFRRSLAQSILSNGMSGGRVVTLFLSPTSEEVQSAAMALRAQDPKGKDLLESRIRMEMERANPDLDLVGFLNYLQGVFETK